MNTDDLIASLGDDLTDTPPAPMATAILRAIALGLGVSLALFVILWGIRPDPGAVLQDLSLFAKSALPLALGAFALPWMLAQARPAGRSRARRAIPAVPLVLGVLMAATLYAIPVAGWRAAVMGQSITTCLISIPALSAPLLIAALVALRRGAPERPTLCGAAAGLMAAGFGAAIYSMFCTEDSPLFYGVWYSLAVLAVAAAGALAGRRILRW